ncbi:MAG TPA: hypothetical protein VKR06_19085 [Ktedonosporobacter sp.]|nr:hypothetical protein [Ktedonosporobacter sp.]
MRRIIFELILIVVITVVVTSIFLFATTLPGSDQTLLRAPIVSNSSLPPTHIIAESSGQQPDTAPHCCDGDRPTG